MNTSNNVQGISIAIALPKPSSLLSPLVGWCTTWCTRGVEVNKPIQPCEFILRFSLIPSSVHTSTAMGLSQYRNSSEHTAQTNPIFLVYSLVSKEAIDYKYRLQCILLYPESWFSYWDGLQLPPYPVLK